jgi:hypothetical protein
LLLTLSRKPGIFTEEAIAWMNALAAFPLRNLNDPITVKVGTRLANVYGKGRGEGVLGKRVGVCIDGCGANAILGCSASDPSTATLADILRI